MHVFVHLCVSVPVSALSRHTQGLAKTGSGKTAAFVLPMLVHVMDQPELCKGQGPIAIILAPTRELSEQIHRETRKFAKPYGEHAASCVAFVLFVLCSRFGRHRHRHRIMTRHAHQPVLSLHPASTTPACVYAGLRCVAAFGGLSKYEQVKELKAGAPPRRTC